MSKISQIKERYSKELAIFEQQFKASTKTNVPLLDTIMGYVIKRKGKQMRPLFVLLSASIFGEINTKTYRAAAMVELLHTATLAHDDVVDDSYKRRGFFSINALWKNKIAVLVGDYLLSRGLLLAVENKDFDLLTIVSSSVKAMSEGELLQLEKARRLDINEQVYFEIIKGKTASLIASCCALGASAMQENQKIIDDFYAFGLNVGIAFQLKDDIFDYGTKNIGKPLSIDIKEKKMTLPLIIALNKCSKQEKNKIINIFKSKQIEKKDIEFITEQVIKYDGIAYAEEQMKKYIFQAKEIIKPYIASNTDKNYLINLVDFVIERTT